MFPSQYTFTRTASHRSEASTVHPPTRQSCFRRGGRVDRVGVLAFLELVDHGLRGCCWFGKCDGLALKGWFGELMGERVLLKMEVHGPFNLNNLQRGPPTDIGSMVRCSRADISNSQRAK